MSNLIYTLGQDPFGIQIFDFLKFGFVGSMANRNWNLNILFQIDDWLLTFGFHFVKFCSSFDFLLSHCSKFVIWEITHVNKLMFVNLWLLSDRAAGDLHIILSIHGLFC